MPFFSVSGNYRSPESSPLGSRHTLSCSPVVSSSAPQILHWALWKPVTEKFCIFRLLWTLPLLCPHDSLPRLKAWPLVSWVKCFLPHLRTSRTPTSKFCDFFHLPQLFLAVGLSTQDWKPEFNPGVPHSERREGSTPANRPPTSTQLL